jgi:hypothetical protein
MPKPWDRFKPLYHEDFAMRYHGSREMGYTNNRQEWMRLTNEELDIYGGLAEEWVVTALGGTVRKQKTQDQGYDMVLNGLTLECRWSDKRYYQLIGARIWKGKKWADLYVLVTGHPWGKAKIRGYAKRTDTWDNSTLGGGPPTPCIPQMRLRPFEELMRLAGTMPPEQVSLF